MLLKHVDSKNTTFLSFVLLCIYSFTVVNIPSIRFLMIHVYKPLYMCIFTCLDKYTICYIIRPVCITHLSFIMYLLCRHLRTVYKMFVHYISQYYGCVMSTYLSDSMTLIKLLHLYIILDFIFQSALKNATQTLPIFRRHNDTRFRNSNHSNLFKIKCYHDLLQWYIPPRFPSCCFFCGKIDGRVVISILVFCLYYLSSTILIILINVKMFF